MAHATINYSNSDVQDRPVYVVTDMSSPPWEPVELHHSGQHTASGEVIFSRAFQGDFSEGDHPYKLRLGNDEWIVDPTQPTTYDRDGNLNNVVRAEVSPSSSNTEEEETTVEILLPHEQDLGAISTGSTYPRASNGGNNHGQDDDQNDHSENDSKNDDYPDNGDNDDDDAPDGTRAVDRFNAKSKNGKKETDNTAAFPHELGPSENMPDGSQTKVAQGTSSSTDTEDVAINKSLFLSHEMNLSDSSQNIAANDTMLLSHERDESADNEKLGELANAPRFSFETGPVSASEPVESQHDSALVEEWPSSDEERSSESGSRSQGTHDNELDRPPPLSHETGLESEESNPSEPETTRLHLFEASSPDPDAEEDVFGLFYALSPTQRRHIVDTEEAENELERGFSLSHEQSFPVEFESKNYHGNAFGRASENVDDGSEGSISAPSSPTFKRAGSIVFRRKSSRDSLPHSMPHSDAEDPDLKAGGLELFPTRRDKILNQIKSTGNKLPEDVFELSFEDAMSSPERPTMSQACSSVELEPVRSHTSLSAIAESTALEEEYGTDSEPACRVELIRRDGDSGEDGLVTANDGTSSGEGLAADSDHNGASREGPTTAYDGANSEGGPASPHGIFSGEGVSSTSNSDAVGEGAATADLAAETAPENHAVISENEANVSQDKKGNQGNTVASLGGLFAIVVVSVGLLSAAWWSW